VPFLSVTPEDSVEISKYFVGQKLNDVHDKTIIHITKMTDGTLKTTFKGHLYILYNPKTKTMCRDIDGRAFTRVEPAYLNGPGFPPGADKVKIGRHVHGTIGEDKEAPLEWRHDSTLPDPENKRVWWFQNPRYEYEISQDLKDEKGLPQRIEKIVGGEPMVGTHEEFFAAVAEYEKLVADQKSEKEALELKKTTIAAGIIADKAMANASGKPPEAPTPEPAATPAPEAAEPPTEAPAPSQCAATTASGERCKRPAGYGEGEAFCPQHAKKD
jgi:hypothetical protein